MRTAPGQIRRRRGGVCLLPALGILAVAACATPAPGPTLAPLSTGAWVGDTHMGVRLLGVVVLGGDFAGAGPSGLSGLAWDGDAGLLYAVSDRGTLWHLRPGFSAGALATVEVVAAYPLLGRDGRPLAPPWSDAEGMDIAAGNNAVTDDATLLISFEGRPRLAEYDSRGHWRGERALPPPLDEAGYYASTNKALEAVALHPRRGFLTGPEWPPAARGGDARVVALRGADGARWDYTLGPAANSALVAMEVLPDGAVLMLERAYVSPLHPLVISLRRAQLPEPPGHEPVISDVAVFDSSRGWRLDNFEGLARHRDRRFFLVSDDNFHPLQRTLLLYVEVLPGGD